MFSVCRSASHFVKRIGTDVICVQARSWVSLKGVRDIKCLERNGERRRRERLGGYGGMLTRKILKISVLSNDFSCILSPLLYHFG